MIIFTNKYLYKLPNLSTDEYMQMQSFNSYNKKENKYTDSNMQWKQDRKWENKKRQNQKKKK